MAHPARAFAASALPRRRRSAEARMERTSVTLRADVLEAAKAVGGNLSAFIEEAVEEKLRRTRRAALYAAYDEAFANPEFVKDMDSVTAAFSVADRDGISG